MIYLAIQKDDFYVHNVYQLHEFETPFKALKYIKKNKITNEWKIFREIPVLITDPEFNCGKEKTNES